jgi:wobble nucleotide-excising tRNase
MIKKILKIDNVGRFDNYRPRGNVELAAFSLVFAENSRGKTTLCDIFRSLQCGEGAYILGRKRLGSAGDPEADVLLDNKTVKFRNGAWDTLHADITIFDNTFIHQNVFSGDYVDHDQKRNLYRVIVGEQGVVLAKAVDELDAKVKEANRDLGTKKQLLERMMPAGINLTDFLALPVEADIEKKIPAKEKELAEATTASKRSAEIKAKGLLKPLALPAFPTAFNNLLAESLDTISKDAEKKIQEHINTHTTGVPEEWLSKGLGYIKGNDCPLCGQEIAGLELISAYQSIFDARYQDFKIRLAAFEKTLADQFSIDAFQAAQKIANENSVLVEFWTQFDSLTLPADFIDGARDALTGLKNLADELLRKKIALPLEVVSRPPELDAALAKYADFSSNVVHYNGEVQKINEKIAKIKAQAQSADPVKLKKELDALKCVQSG